MFARVAQTSSAASRPAGASPARLSLPATLQPKLALDTPGDRFEREADHVADRVMRMSAPESHFLHGVPAIQRMCAGCAEEEHKDDESIHRKASAEAATPAANVEQSVSAASRQPGRALSESERAFFEPRFNHDFGRVRVHADGAADAAARDVGALAFTYGGNIYLRADQQRTDTDAGRRLLAHELTHTVQQSAASPSQRE